MTTFPALLLILLLALNPPRAMLLAPGQTPMPRRQAALAAFTAVLILGTAAAASPFLAALSITPQTFRIAAGIGAGITGLAWFAYPGRRALTPHPSAPLFPFAWPLLANPASVLLTVSFAADAGALLTLLAIAPPLALAAGLPTFVHANRGIALTLAARLTGAVLTVAALALILRGVEAV